MNAIEQQKNVVVASGGNYLGCGLFLVLLSLALLLQELWGVGSGLVLVGGVLIWFGYSKSRKAAKSQTSIDMQTPELKALRDQVIQLENLIAEKRRIANG